MQSATLDPCPKTAGARASTMYDSHAVIGSIPIPACSPSFLVHSAVNGGLYELRRSRTLDPFTYCRESLLGNFVGADLYK